MSEWHLKRTRGRLQQARKAIGEAPLSSDGFDDRIIDLLAATGVLIEAIDRKLDQSETAECFPALDLL